MVIVAEHSSMRRKLLRSYWRGKWQPTPIFLPREFHGQRTWRAAVRGVTKSQTHLSDYHSLTHSSLKSVYLSILKTPRSLAVNKNGLNLFKDFFLSQFYGTHNLQGHEYHRKYFLGKSQFGRWL